MRRERHQSVRPEPGMRLRLRLRRLHRRHELSRCRAALPRRILRDVQVEHGLQRRDAGVLVIGLPMPRGVHEQRAMSQERAGVHAGGCLRGVHLGERLSRGREVLRHVAPAVRPMPDER